MNAQPLRAAGALVAAVLASASCAGVAPDVGASGAGLERPARELALEAPDGAEVRIAFYVVESRRVTGCADPIVLEEPVVRVDGALAARGWEALEAGWRGWGGTLEALRALRRAPACTVES